MTISSSRTNLYKRVFHVRGLGQSKIDRERENFIHPQAEIAVLQQQI